MLKMVFAKRCLDWAVKIWNTENHGNPTETAAGWSLLPETRNEWNLAIWLTLATNGQEQRTRTGKMPRKASFHLLFSVTFFAWQHCTLT
jgi:hypothetical protein